MTWLNFLWIDGWVLAPTEVYNIILLLSVKRKYGYERVSAEKLFTLGESSQNPHIMHKINAPLEVGMFSGIVHNNYNKSKYRLY